MLALTRNVGQSVVLSDAYTTNGVPLPSIYIEVVEVSRRQARVRFHVHASVAVIREDAKRKRKLLARTNDEDRLCHLTISLREGTGADFHGLCDSEGNPLSCRFGLFNASHGQARVTLRADKRITILRDELVPH